MALKFQHGENGVLEAVEAVSPFDLGGEIDEVCAFLQALKARGFSRISDPEVVWRYGEPFVEVLAVRRATSEECSTFAARTPK